MRLGEMLKCYRLWHDRTVRELGEEIGVSAATISRIETGEMPSAVSLLLILNWMMGAKISPPPRTEKNDR